MPETPKPKQKTLFGDSQREITIAAQAEIGEENFWKMGLDKMVNLSGKIVPYKAPCERPKELEHSPPYTTEYYLPEVDTHIRLEVTLEEALSKERESLLKTLRKWFNGDANLVLEEIHQVWDYDKTNQKNTQNVYKLIEELLTIPDIASQTKWTIKYGAEPSLIEKFKIDFSMSLLISYMELRKRQD